MSYIIEARAIEARAIEARATRARAIRSRGIRARSIEAIVAIVKEAYKYKRKQSILVTAISKPKNILITSIL